MNRNTALFLPMSVFVAGGLLISGVREQHVMQPRAPMATLPTVIAGLSSRDVTVADEERRIAGMSDYTLREFLADSITRFSVYVGYYDRQVQGKSIHSPKNCLPGAGWEIMESGRVPLPSGTPGETVNRVRLANKGVQALVYYWYQGRGRVASNEYLVKWNLLRDAALYGRTEEALVRIVVPIPMTATPNRSAAEHRAAQGAAIRAADSLSVSIIPGITDNVKRVLPPSPRA